MITLKRTIRYHNIIGNTEIIIIFIRNACEGLHCSPTGVIVLNRGRLISQQGKEDD